MQRDCLLMGVGKKWGKSLQKTPDIQLPRAEVGQESWEKNYPDTLDIKTTKAGGGKICRKKTPKILLVERYHNRHKRTPEWPRNRQLGCTAEKSSRAQKSWWLWYKAQRDSWNYNQTTNLAESQVPTLLSKQLN